MANSGSDVGAIGHIRAFDTQNGKQLWNFDIVPVDRTGFRDLAEGQTEGGRRRVLLVCAGYGNRDPLLTNRQSGTRLRRVVSPRRQSLYVQHRDARRANRDAPRLPPAGQE